ncbi:MAG: hypothetical protein V4510_02105 [bacterium]
MATSKNEPTSTPRNLTSSGSTRMFILLLGVAVVIGAFVAPWWTRGVTLNHDCAYNEAAQDCPRSSGGVSFGGAGVPGIEGLFLNYGPFHTPTASGIGTDASRETATSVLGIGAVTATLFAVAGLVVRGLTATGRITTSANLPVRLAIVAFSAGLFTVLWATFFLPLLGNGPGMLWGSNFSGSQNLGIFYDSRFANVGYYLGIIGFVGLPAYLWVDAVAARNATGVSTGNWQAGDASPMA